MFITETPSDFIFRGADILSPVNENDVILAHRRKYMRIGKSNYDGLPVTLDIIREALGTLDLIDLNLMLDGFITYAFNKETTFCPIVCTKRLKWCNRQLNHIHEHDNLLYMGIFSIGIVEYNDGCDDGTWAKLLEYMTIQFKELEEKYPVLSLFKLYDDSTSTHNIITFECTRKVQTFDFEQRNQDHTTITSNNPTVVRAYRRVLDSYKVLKYCKDEIGSLDPIVIEYSQKFLNVIDNYDLDDAFQAYKKLNDEILYFITESDSFDLATRAYEAFVYMLAEEIQLINHMSKFANLKRYSNDIICIINNTVMMIKDRYLTKAGLHSDATTLAVMYRNQCINNKDLINDVTRRLLT